MVSGRDGRDDRAAALLLWAAWAWQAAQAAPAAWPPGTTACVACHTGSSAEVPRLAGLPSDYLVKRLRDLRDGERAADATLQAAHALDRETARRLAQGLALATAAPWPASGGAEGQRLYEQGKQAQGRPACQVCHGNAAGLAPGMSAPPLQGQPKAYLVKQLQAWRDGRRRNSPEDLMNDAARGLTDAEIEALGCYLGTP